MAGLGAAVVIDAPPLSPPPNGLLMAASVIDHGLDDTRWMNGVYFSPESASGLTVFDPCVTTSGDVVASVTDGVTNSTTTVTSATAIFTAMDVGKAISGAGIPAGATIVTINSPTSIVISSAATASASGVTLTFTGRNPGSNRTPSLLFKPFVIEAYDSCTAIGFQKADYEGRARRALDALQTTAIEHEFMTGATHPTNRHLQDNTNTTTLRSGTAQGLRASLAALVQAIADNNMGRGMIHARPGLVALWSSQNMLQIVNGKLQTYTGALVVPGSGYTGAKPDGTAATTTSEWAYATHAAQVHRGEVEVFASGDPERLDRTNDTITVRAQRAVSVAFNAATVVAVNVDPTSTS